MDSVTVYVFVSLLITSICGTLVITRHYYEGIARSAETTAYLEGYRDGLENRSPEDTDLENYKWEEVL